MSDVRSDVRNDVRNDIRTGASKMHTNRHYRKVPSTRTQFDNPILGVPGRHEKHTPTTGAFGSHMNLAVFGEICCCLLLFHIT